MWAIGTCLSMNKDFLKYNPVRKLKINLYLKACSTFYEVECAIKELKHPHDHMEYISVIGKVADHEVREFTGSSTFLSHIYAIKTDYLSIPEVGNIFVAGPLSSLLLEKIDGKALGSLEGGLIGILTGYGVAHKKSLKYLEDLKQGKFIVVARGYWQEEENKPQSL